MGLKMRPPFKEDRPEAAAGGQGACGRCEVEAAHG
jgi:hypothetical protein